MTSRRKHFYMGCALVQFTKDGKPYSHHTNFIIQTDEKKITSSVLTDANRMVNQTSMSQLQLNEGDLKNIVFMGWSYLGLMTEREFTGQKTPDNLPFDA